MTKNPGFQALLILVGLVGLSSAQTTVTLTNTVLQANATHPGIDPSQLTEYGNGQLYKSLFYADGGDLPSYYMQDSFQCNVGGSGGTPTTTLWPNGSNGASATVTSYSASGTVVTLNGTGFGFFGNQQVYFSGFSSATFLNGQSAFLSTASSTQVTFNWNSSAIGTTADSGTITYGYIPNFFAGATFRAYNSSTGASYGTGTITASTGTTTSNGVSFTLSPAISQACTNGDVIIIKLTSVNNLMTPGDLFGRTGASVCANASWNTSDISPSSANPYHSLSLPTGCSITLDADQTLNNATNSNSTLASTLMNSILINGSYTQSLKYKCGAASGTGSMTYSVSRVGGSTFISPTTVTPTCTATAGSGWASVSGNNFTGTETVAPGGNLQYTISCNSGPCLLNDLDVVEGTALPGGNPTPFRDDFVRRLQQLNPGVIRWMDSTDWCSSEADVTGTLGARRWCNINSYLPFILYGTMGYAEKLQLCAFINTDCYLSVGMSYSTAEWQSLITWLSTNTSYTTLVANGKHVYLAHGNEAFNSGAGGALYEGDGTLYGAILGPDLAAARAATGFSATSMKLVGNSWFTSNQSYGFGGWIYNTLTAAALTTNGLPDYVEIAPYNFSFLGSYSTTGSNVSTTASAPWLDMSAEITNYDSGPFVSNSTSVINSVAYVKAHWPTVQTMVYEMGIGTISGEAVTQGQLNQIDAGVGQALAITLHHMLMRRDAGVTGPLGTFALTELYNGYSCVSGSCVGGVVFPAWGIERLMGCGPGNLSTCSDASRPASIAMQVVNNAIGSNSNFMVTSQSGTPTYSYAADQDNGGTPTILANSSVPYVDCGAYSNGSTAWTVLCWNKNISSSEMVTLTGAGAPTGSVTEWVYPKSGESLISNNENTYLGTSSIAPQDVLPTFTLTSGTSYTIPPASMIALAYMTGAGPPPPTAPVSLTGKVTTTGTVVIQ